MSDKPESLQDKEASDQVKVASGEQAASISGRASNPVPLQPNSEREVGRPLGRGFGKTRFDNVSSDPNKRKHIGEDPNGEENLKLHKEAGEK